MRNPMEESYPPDNEIEKFTITASRCKHAGRADTWYVTCPEYAYKNETNEAINIHIERIVNDIQRHNDWFNANAPKCNCEPTKPMKWSNGDECWICDECEATCHTP